jgi:hypothetical protein
MLLASPIGVAVLSAALLPSGGLRSVESTLCGVPLPIASASTACESLRHRRDRPLRCPHAGSTRGAMP